MLNVNISNCKAYVKYVIGLSELGCVCHLIRYIYQTIQHGLWKVEIICTSINPFQWVPAMLIHLQEKRWICKGAQYDC